MIDLKDLEDISRLIGGDFLFEHNIMIMSLYFPSCEIIPNSSSNYKFKDKIRILNPVGPKAIFKNAKDKDDLFYTYSSNDLKIF